MAIGSFARSDTTIQSHSYTQSDKSSERKPVPTSNCITKCIHFSAIIGPVAVSRDYGSARNEDISLGRELLGQLWAFQRGQTTQSAHHAPSKRVYTSLLGILSRDPPYIVMLQHADMKGKAHQGSLRELLSLLHRFGTACPPSYRDNPHSCIPVG